MAIEGFHLLDDTAITSLADTDILTTDITIPGPVNQIIEIQVQVFQSTSALFRVNVNSVTYVINNAVAIEGAFNFTVLAKVGDTINYQTSIGSVIRIMTAVGGTP